MTGVSDETLDVAVVGAGIAGVAARRRHRVMLYEAASRLGGRTHNVVVGAQSLDTGFIVYNEATYPSPEERFPEAASSA